MMNKNKKKINFIIFFIFLYIILKIVFNFYQNNQPVELSKKYVGKVKDVTTDNSLIIELFEEKEIKTLNLIGIKTDSKIKEILNNFLEKQLLNNYIEIQFETNKINSCYLYHNNFLINKIILEQGFAFYDSNSHSLKENLLLQAEKYAQVNHLGIWK